MITIYWLVLVIGNDISTMPRLEEFKNEEQCITAYNRESKKFPKKRFGCLKYTGPVKIKLNEDAT